MLAANGNLVAWEEASIGAEVAEAGAGVCVIEVPFRDELTQQESLFHGAVTGAIADNAGGYAALTLAPPDREVLTVEYKVNFLAPAYGEKLVARGGTTPSSIEKAVRYGFHGIAFSSFLWDHDRPVDKFSEVIAEFHRLNLEIE